MIARWTARIVLGASIAAAIAMTLWVPDPSMLMLAREWEDLTLLVEPDANGRWAARFDVTGENVISVWGDLQYPARLEAGELQAPDGSRVTARARDHTFMADPCVFPTVIEIVNMRPDRAFRLQDVQLPESCREGTGTWTVSLDLATSGAPLADGIGELTIRVHHGRWIAR